MSDQNRPTSSDGNGQPSDSVAVPAKDLPLPNTVQCSELAQVNESLVAMRDARSKLLGKLKHAERKNQKKNAEIKSIQDEKQKIITELATIKADLLKQLLDAERKIKQLEQELGDAKTFLTRHVLAANDAMVKVIRARYGDGSELATLSNAPIAAAAPFNPPETNEPPQINMSLDVSNATGEIPASSIPAIELPPPAAATGGQTASEALPEPLNVSNEDDAVEVVNEQMETDDDECVIQFACDQCPRTFVTMALKYRHETKTHGNKHVIDEDDDEESENDVENPPKAVKRQRSPFAAKKTRPTKRHRKQEDLMKILANYNSSDILRLSPVLNELERLQRLQRVKKIAGKNRG